MKALVFKIALNKRLNNQKWIRMDGKKSKYNPLASVERKISTIRTTRTKIAKKT